MGHTMQKHVFGVMRTAKAEVCTSVQSDPGLSANRIIGYYIKYEWRAKSQMILCACAGWSESVHFVHAQRHIFWSKWKSQQWQEKKKMEDEFASIYISHPESEINLFLEIPGEFATWKIVYSIFLPSIHFIIVDQHRIRYYIYPKC